MKKEEFIELYKTLTLKELCKHLKCSTTLIYSLLDKYEIPRKYNSCRDFNCLKGKRNSRIKLDE